MVSPLMQQGLSQGEYIPEEEAAFSAYLDIQEEVEDFIPFDDNITKEIEKEIE